MSLVATMTSYMVIGLLYGHIEAWLIDCDDTRRAIERRSQALAYSSIQLSFEHSLSCRRGFVDKVPLLPLSPAPFMEAREACYATKRRSCIRRMKRSGWKRWSRAKSLDHPLRPSSGARFVFARWYGKPELASKPSSPVILRRSAAGVALIIKNFVHGATT